MANDQLVAVASFLNVQEASIAKGLLEEEGIETFVDGAEAATTLWYVGTALGGVQLLVSQRNATKAKHLLASVERSHRDDSETEATWTCARCGADVEGDFEVCWSCGRPRHSESPNDIRGGFDVEPLSSFAEDNPDGGDNLTSAADATAARAWRCAIFGIAFFPLLFYAAALAVSVSDQKLSPRATRQYYGALAVIVGMFLVLWFFVRQFN
jgi:hypothetical protein